MKLVNDLSQLDPAFVQALLKDPQEEHGMPLNPRIPGKSYYNYEGGLLVLKTLAKLLKTPSRTTRINLLHAQNQVRTYQARFKQGAAYLNDGGLIHYNAGHAGVTDEEFEQIKKCISHLHCRISKFTVILTVTPPEDADRTDAKNVDDIISLMEEVPVTKEPAEFDAEGFRMAVTALIEGPFGGMLEREPGLQCWPGVPPLERAWVERVKAQSGPNILYSFDETNKSVYLTKVDDDTLAALAG